MGFGRNLPPSQGDTFEVEFVVTGAPSATLLTTTSEQNLDLGVSTFDEWIAPTACRVEAVFCNAELLASGDIVRFRVRRRAAGAGTDDDLIRNAVGGSAVDYIQFTATTANEIQNVKYSAVLQDTSVAPSFSSDLSAETAVGFLESEATFAAGDVLTATGVMGAAGDSASHIKCAVIMSRMD